MKKNNKKGFTLAELLIVVAIIAILVAVAIPVFTTQLEKSKKAVDEANCRSAYGEAVADYLAGGMTTSTGTVKVAESTYSWVYAGDSTSISNSTAGKSDYYKKGIGYDGSSFRPVP